MKEAMPFTEKASEPLWLRERRKNAFTQFELLPPPSSQHGLGIVSHPSLLQEDLPEDIEGFVHEGLEVLPLSKALQTRARVLEEHLFRSLPVDDWNGAFHTMLCEHIWLVYAPAGVKAVTPLSLSAIATSGFTHLVVVAEPGSAFTLVDTPKSDRLRLYSRATELVIKEGAKVNYVASHRYPDDLKTFSLAIASVEKDGQLHWIEPYQGGQVVSSRSKAHLLSPGATVVQQQILLGQGEQSLDVQSSVTHLAPHTKSKMISKGVLLDRAKAVTRGLIKMEHGASQSEGYQQQDMLLLSEEAEVDPLPVLEINQDDVKCKHGATVTEIDDDHLYYLMSRGLNQEMARQELIEGFFGGVVDQVPDERLRLDIRDSVAASLRRDHE
jgi:Fe-S cluster assembly protein SufD